MVVLQFLVATICCVSLVAEGVSFTHLTDFKDFDPFCVADHLARHHNFNLTVKLREKKVDYCKKYIKNLEKSFYNTARDLFCSDNNAECKYVGVNRVRDCTLDLLVRHQVADVFLKAIAYNYFTKSLVKFSPSETCKNIASVVHVEDCEYREMRIQVDGDYKSSAKLQTCLDDLFGGFHVDEIILGDEKIGVRSFGSHLRGFLQQLNATARVLCSKIDNDLKIKFFDIKHPSEAHNRTKIECFKKSFVGIYGESDFDSNTDTEEVGDEECEEIIQEQVEDAIAINLFGFPDAYQRVQSCIARRNLEEKFIDRVIILPVVSRDLKLTLDNIHIPLEEYISSTKMTMEVVLDCLRYF